MDPDQIPEPRPIPPPRRMYRLQIRFEIRAVNRKWYDSTSYNDNWTNEALTIEDSLDLIEARTLTQVLAQIDAIHNQLATLAE